MLSHNGAVYKKVVLMSKKKSEIMRLPSNVVWLILILIGAFALLTFLLQKVGPVTKSGEAAHSEVCEKEGVPLYRYWHPQTGDHFYLLTLVR